MPLYRTGPYAPRGPCRITGCTRESRSYTRLCEAHRHRDRRHGHPQQATIHKHHLKPYRQRIERWLNGRPADMWVRLETVFAKMLEITKEEVRATERARVYNRFELQSARDVLAVGEQADTREALLTVLAMVILWYEEPSTFRSDRAFWTQLARRWRGLVDTNAASYWSHQQGRMLRVYRDVNPRAAELLGRRLAIALGPYALAMKRAWKDEAVEHERVKREAVEALEQPSPVAP